MFSLRKARMYGRRLVRVNIAALLSPVVRQKIADIQAKELFGDKK